MNQVSLQGQFNQAMGLHQSGNLGAAEQIYLRLLQIAPSNYAVLHMLGVLRGQQGRNPEALEFLEAALRVDKRDAGAWMNKGNVLRAMGRHGEALAAFDKALSLAAPARPDMLFNRAVTLMELGRLPEALAAFDRLLALKPDFAEAWAARGMALGQLGRLDDALASYDRTLKLRPDADTLNKRGIVLWQMGRGPEGLASLEQALTLAPNFIDAWVNRANALRHLRRLPEALASSERALALNPNFAPAHDHRGAVLWEMHRYDEALASYDRAIALMPDRADFHSNRAVLLRDMGRMEEALAAADRAIALAPNYAEAHYNRANNLQNLKRYEESLLAYERARVLDPGLRYTLAGIAWMALLLCDWDKAEEVGTALKNDRHAIVSPLVLLGYDSDPAMQLEATRNHVAERVPVMPPPMATTAHGHDKIRLGYISTDFNRHPVAYQIVELIEKHDRSRFTVTGISIGAHDGSDIRARLETAFDAFHDLRNLDSGSIAARIREMEIDILIDLSGHTANSRVDIMAHHPAPVQVSYLGYPATMAAPFIDYVLADPVVLPMDRQPFYPERIVHLPHSYWVGAPLRSLPPPPSRAEAGLPAQGFVFCAFNNHWKTGRQMFDIWIQLLNGVPGSVLWLKEADEGLRARLRGEAAKRGVEPGRLVFAPAIDSPADHLARHALADLFLDTLPYNAHATASDALWAGLPVITAKGGNFSGRVAASLLRAVGLDELVTENLEDYAALALALARDPARLAEVRARLQKNRLTMPLFDSDASARALEAAFIRMQERAARGESPEAFAVD